MSIEQKAVNKINALFENCMNLDPQIPINDKGILTDGHINVFNTNSDSHSVEDFAGRVNVQVKGTSVTEFKDKLSYSVARKALEGFLKLRGVLYFVVALQRDGKKKAYYLDLSPFEIMKILNGMKSEAQSKTLHFKRLPTTPEKFTAIVQLALKRLEEDPWLGFEGIDPENIRGFTIHSLGNINFNRPVILNRDELDFAIEVNTDSGRILVDANVELTPQEYLPTRIKIPVASGIWEVESYTWRRLSESEAEVMITPGIRLTTSRIGEKVSLSVTFTPQDGLIHQHFDLGFMISLAESGELRFGTESEFFRFPFLSDLEDLKSQFALLDKLITLLDHLEIDCALISLNSITDKQWRQLEDMYSAIVMNEEFTQDVEASNRRILQPIGPWFIELFITPGEYDGRWKLHGLTDLRTAHWAQRVNQDSESPLFHEVTPYEIIAPERLSHTLNLRPSAIQEHYDLIREHNYCTKIATTKAFDFLHAADISATRRDEFLDLAERLNEWLVSKNGHQPQLLINQWQIQARRSSLTSDERFDVRKLRRSLGPSSEEQQCVIGCAILLGDHEEVSDLIAGMTIHDKQQLESLPIWSFWMDSQLNRHGLK